MKTKIKNVFKIAVLMLLIINISCEGEGTLSNENEIISFSLTAGDFTKDFETNNDVIEGVVPYTIDGSNISLRITISEKATIAPDPSAITTIDGIANFVVIAEDGTKREYVVDIERELSPENTIVSFEVKTSLFDTNADIDNETGTINQRVLPGTVLTDIETTIEVSNGATITPDPKTIFDYSSPVAFTVTAENGETKEYLVTLALMDEEYMIQCDITNAFKWFGGDDRPTDPDFPEAFGDRNVGTGQTIRLLKDLNPTSFGAHFQGAFEYATTRTPYEGDFELKLNIRRSDGTIFASKNTLVSGPFMGGWIDFDLSSINLLLERNTDYYFTWYLVDGEALEITASSTANLDETEDESHNGGGFAGQARERDNANLEDWNTWFEHEWHFSFRLEGKQ
ncbi:DUF5018 domain-containing protein [Aquimarina sp. AD10]|uniref:DUF5018 domain-containing protein n=1 Tax=Aquimarina sp. AD10 TaxID=1714849 RepID=UPI000E51CD3E|nr:DUF5018 domain-containing protein [Aquimarina sp. AD10]AXT61588.1 DUF5018 domain-containing protein [Aquimarina sp. AD10]RKM90073.1 DUF5018 domain-containing protein [Aquimarina sp. AD10]